jgi:hypothetical protein
MTGRERQELEWYAAESQFILQIAQAHQQRLIEVNAIMKWEDRRGKEATETDAGGAPGPK